MSQITILHSNPYNFVDEKTQNTVKGLKLDYIFTDDLEPIELDNREKGYSPAKASISYDLQHKVKAVPGVYQAKFYQSVNAKGQLIQKLIDVDFICTIPQLYTTQDKKAAV